MADDNSLFAAAGGRLEAAAAAAEVSDDTLERLRLPKSVLKVSIPVRMDDGSLRTFPGYRARLHPGRRRQPLQEPLLRIGVDPSANRSDKDQHATGRRMSDTDMFGRTDLHYAAADDDTSRVRETIAAGAEVSLRDHERMTPLHFAAQQSSLAAARELIAAGAEVDAQDDNGNTPLSRAVFESRGRTDMIALLREHGADPMLENHHGRSPLGLAKLMGEEGALFPDLQS